jgi:hypothetical protein
LDTAVGDALDRVEHGVLGVGLGLGGDAHVAGEVAGFAGASGASGDVGLPSASRFAR